jgi:uncharacterized membrane protein
MSTSNLSSQEIRAAAETHRELGPDYHDAVVESFLAKVETEIEARVDARLAASPPARRGELATLAKRRLALKHMALGSVAAAIPLSVFSLWVYGRTANGNAIGPWMGTIVSLAVVWILIAAVYAACAFPLRPPPRDRE